MTGDRLASDGGVAAYYADIDAEWHRLVKDTYHRIEFDVVHRAVCARVPVGGHLLELGSGPGQRALRFAAQGYRMTLNDVSEGSLHRAADEFVRAGLSARLAAVHCGSALELRVDEPLFDAVLAFGPLYHLLEADADRDCLARAAAAIRPGGYLFAIFLTRLSVPKDLIRLGLVEEASRVLQSDYLRTGVYQVSSLAAGRYMPSARTHTLQEAKALLVRVGLELESVQSCEGLAAFLGPEINERYSDRPSLERLVDVLELAIADPSVIEAGDHFLAIARRPL